MKFFSRMVYCFIVLLAGCNHSEVPKQKHKITQPPPQPEQKQENVTIQQIVASAKSGQAQDIPFTAHQNTISEVKKAWGEPDKVDPAGSGYYATYTKKDTAFGYTKDGRIFDVRSFNPSIQVFSLSDIKQEMGNPTNTTFYDDDDIYTYQVNSQYQLKWVIPRSTGKVDHISIYSPPEVPYFLSIKGTSEKLTASAWEKMQQWRQEVLAYPKKYPNDVFVNGPNKKMVALTFDDGPDRINTPKIIAALKQQNVKGTFFFIGQKVQKNPDVVKSAYENGNVIASHSFYHHELPKESAAEIQQDLAKTSEVIRSVIGKSPALLRPPYGEIDDKLVNAANDYKIVLWSIDTLDWSQKDQAHIQKNVFDNVRNGDIILMHSDDDKLETAKAVPLMITELKRRGFEIVDVATLLNTNPYR